MNILGPSKISATAAAEVMRRKGATTEFVGLAAKFWAICPQHGGVCPEVAYAQSFKETAGGRYGRAVTPAHHNPAGLKIRDPSAYADDDPRAHVTFDSWDHGIAAQADHLADYAGHPDYPLPWPDKTYDQRNFASIHGKAKTVEELGGAWAPSRTYGLEIAALVDEMRGAKPNAPKEEPVTQVGDSPLVSKFVQAYHYGKGPRTKGDISLIVLHAMQSQEKGDTAESVAAYFARKDSRVASANYCVDSNSIVQCVWEADIAYGAKGANAVGVHIEHAGMSEQKPADWDDPYSRAELENSVGLCSDICKRRLILPRFLNAAALKGGERNGITTHAEVSKAFPGSGHWDPGPGFPIARYIESVKRSVEGEELPVDQAAFNKLLDGYFESDKPEEGGPTRGYQVWKALYTTLPTGANGTKEPVTLDEIVAAIAHHDGIELVDAVKAYRASR